MMLTHPATLQSLEQTVGTLQFATGFLLLLCVILVVTVLIYAALISRLRWRLKHAELQLAAVMTAVGLQKETRTPSTL